MVQKAAPRRPGRPRGYDPDTALERATEAFWHAGFAATSLDDLCEATGLNRPSLYGAFGDKRALYLQALERYTERGRRALDAVLGGDRPLSESLARAYAAALSLYLSGDAARGCFLIGTAVTEAAGNYQVREQLGDALRAFDRCFETRFRRAQEEGELDAAADPAALGRIASAVLHTLALRSRAGDSRASLRSTADAAVRVICGAGSAVTKARRKRRA
jgi:AcrR family transcriptional regulator